MNITKTIISFFVKQSLIFFSNIWLISRQWCKIPNVVKINMNLYTILHMYLGLWAKWKANTLINLVYLIKNTHMLSTCQTSPPWLPFIFLYFIVVINEWLSFSWFFISFWFVHRRLGFANIIIINIIMDPFLFTILFNSENKQEWDF
jgi:hypothetical protein